MKQKVPAGARSEGGPPALLFPRVPRYAFFPVEMLPCFHADYFEEFGSVPSKGLKMDRV